MKNNSLFLCLPFTFLSLSNRTPVESNFVVVSDHVCYRFFFFISFRGGSFEGAGRALPAEEEEKEARRRRRRRSLFFKLSSTTKTNSSSKQEVRLLSQRELPQEARTEEGNITERVIRVQVNFFYEFFRSAAGSTGEIQLLNPLKKKKRLRSPRRPRPSPPPSSSRARPGE